MRAGEPPTCEALYDHRGVALRGDGGGGAGVPAGVARVAPRPPVQQSLEGDAERVVVRGIALEAREVACAAGADAWLSDLESGNISLPGGSRAWLCGRRTDLGLA